MSKREGSSRKEEEPKRQKSVSTEEISFIDLLGRTVLTEEEKQEVLANTSLFDYLYERDDRSPKSLSLPLTLSLPPTTAALLKFIRAVPTSKWNMKENARLVFKSFNVRPYIVHPNHYISKFYNSDYEHNRISTILTNLETRKKNHQFAVSWSSLKNHVDEFLAIYECEGLEELANIYGDVRRKERAGELLFAFRNRIVQVKGKTKHNWIYAELQYIVEEMKPGGDPEDQEAFVRLLITFIKLHLEQLSFCERKQRIKLNFPEHYTFSKYYPFKCRDVIPDFCLMSLKGRRIVLVGEIKRRKLKGASESSGEIDSEKGEPVANTSIAEEEDTLVNDEKPDHADADTENKEEEDGKKDFVFRHLDEAEKYKVSCYLPQLLAHMMAAMQNNYKTTGIRNHNKNFQLGFAVEGFKLRFVKLVVRDYLKRFDPEGVEPYVDKLLQGKPMKCDVYMTEEFNLLKRSHVQMFFKMLLAIGYFEYVKRNY